MKHTEKEIKDIAQLVMKDIDWPYDTIKGIRALEYTVQEQIEEMSSQKKHPRFSEYVATLFPFWTVMLDFPEDDGWGERNVMFIRIKDETGEPYEVGHRQWKGHCRGSWHTNHFAPIITGHQKLQVNYLKIQNRQPMFRNTGRRSNNN